MTLPRRVAAFFTVWALAGAACGVLGGDTLSDAQQAIADLSFERSDLRVVGAVDHADRTYRAGEPIVLSAEITRPAYVAVLRVLPNGATTLVFPNRNHAATRLAPHKPLRIALPRVAPEPGTVLYEFVATTNGASWLFARKPEGQGEFAELGTTTRAVAKNIAVSLKPGPGSEAAIAHLAVRVAGK